MFVRSYLQLHTVTWNHVDVAGFEPFISLTLVHSNILDVFQQHTFYLLLLRLLSVLHTAGMSVNSSSPSNSMLNAVNSDCSPSFFCNHQYHQSLYSRPSLHLHPLPGLPTMANSALLPNDESLRHLHLPHHNGGAVLVFGNSRVLLWLLLKDTACNDSGVLVYRYQFQWTDVFSPSSLCGSLLGCCSPPHIPGSKTHRRHQN